MTRERKVSWGGGDRCEGRCWGRCRDVEASVGGGGKENVGAGVWRGAVGGVVTVGKGNV